MGRVEDRRGRSRAVSPDTADGETLECKEAIAGKDSPVLSQEWLT